MNTTSEPLDTPEWGKDEANSISAARLANDAATLQLMADDVLTMRIIDYGTIAEALIENRHLPFDTAYELAKMWRKVFDFGLDLCMRADATLSALEAWSNTSDWFIADIIARHANTDDGLLKKMANSQNCIVATAALSSERLSDDFVDGLASHSHPLVRAHVAQSTGNRHIVALWLEISIPAFGKALQSIEISIKV